jgi:hypothetical protein
MSKCLVVLNSRKPIPNTDQSFIAVYGTFYIYDGYCEIGDQEGIFIKLPNDSVDYIVENLEGTWLEPLSSSADVQVL